MTIILALACVDGVILASDSQATEMADRTRFEVPKIFPLTDSAVWGASGPSAVIDDLRAAFSNARKQFTASQRIENEFRTFARPVLKRHYDAFLPCPNSPNNTPATTILACGLRNKSPWILEVDHSCATTYYSARGFHAIGSGSAMAQMAGALTTHYDLPGKPTAYGELVAYRSLNAVIQTSAFGVGPPIQMWTVTNAGSHQMTPDERQVMSDRVGGWQEMEAETLQQLMSGEPVDELAAIPAPVPDDSLPG